MSSFGSSLNIGTSAIHAAQRGLDVTGQNIANSATPGYTRQRVDLEAIGGPGVPAFWSKYDGTGEGVKVTGITRMNDEFLTARARNSNAALGDVKEQAKTYDSIERTVGEPSNTGLQKQLQNLWNSFGKISNVPTAADQSARSTAVESAKATANQLNAMSNSLQTQWTDTSAQLKANVDSVNKMASDVAKLNAAIRNNNIAKVPSNELLDQRDELIGQISALTGATVKPAALDANADFNSQAVDVYIGTNKLVDGIGANSLKITGASSYPTDGTAPGAVAVNWATGPNAGADANLSTGAIVGQLQGLNVTVPKYLQQFDGIAAKLADTVNTQLSKGFTVDGREGKDLPLFTAAGGGTITASNISVVAGFKPNDLAISGGNPKGVPPALDGNNATAMAGHMSDVGGADSVYRSMVAELGIQAQSVNRNVTVQSNVVKQAEDARDNVSGVSLNEEMTNLIKFQHSFSAAAKFVGVIDQTMDTLINMVR